MLHFPIRKIFSEIFDFKPANFQKWPGKIRLGPNKARDVKSGTEVILLVSICYKSILFGAAYEHKYDYECKIPSPCIVLGCSNTPDPKRGIILHKIPYDGNSRPEAIKRHKRWVDFVKHKHAKLEPSSSSWIYSKHLEAGRTCSPSKFAGANLHSVAKKKDEIDVSSFPTLFAACASEGDQQVIKQNCIYDDDISQVFLPYVTIKKFLDCEGGTYCCRRASTLHINRV